MTGTSPPPSGDRGQAYSLEALVSALFIVTAVLFALNSTAITPLTASTSNKQLQEQNRILSDDVLGTSYETGALEDAVLYYDTDRGRFYGADSTAYNNGPPAPMGDLLNQTLGDKSIAYNIYVEYESSSGEIRRQQLVYQGIPSDHASASTQVLVLYDDDQITAPDNSNTVSEDGQFYIPDAHPDSSVYNVVKVKLVLWKI